MEQPQFNSDFILNSKNPTLVALVIIIIIAITKFCLKLYCYGDSSHPSLPNFRGASPSVSATRWRYNMDCASLYHAAYQRFAKNGMAVLAPGLGTRGEVILLENSMEWAMSQPDDVLSVTEAFLEVNQTEYSLGHRRYWGEPWLFSLVKSQLITFLQKLIPSMSDDIRLAFGKDLRTNHDEWKEIPLEAALRTIIAQISSWFTVDQPLCRNDEYLTLVWKIIDGMMLVAFASGTVPRFLRPVIGSLESWQTRRHIKKVTKLVEPLYN